MPAGQLEFDLFDIASREEPEAEPEVHHASCICLGCDLGITSN